MIERGVNKEEKIKSEEKKEKEQAQDEESSLFPEVSTGTII